MYFKLAWRNIWRNKRRTLITAASILFAVFFASVMRSIQEGSYSRMVENVVNFYSGYAQVHQNGYWEEKSLEESLEFTEDLQSLPQNIEGLEDVAPRLESFALASFGKLTKGTQVVGIDPTKEQSLIQLEAKLSEGDYLANGEKSVLVSQGLANYLKLGLGDTLVLISQGFRGANAAGKYPVKGIAKFGSPALNGGLVFLPLAEAQWFYAADNRLTSLVLKVNQPKEVAPMISKVKSQLPAEQYEVMGWQDMMPELVQQIELDRAGGIVWLGVLYLIITFGIFGTILMMTAERKREMGILMAVGMKRQTMSLVMWLEIILLGILGTIAGILVSTPVCYYLQVNPITMTGEAAKAYEKFGVEPILPAMLDPTIFMNQAVFVFVVTSLIALYPIWVIWRMRPVEAMRS